VHEGSYELLEDCMVGFVLLPFNLDSQGLVF
jgi:hypothetical protein